MKVNDREKNTDCVCASMGAKSTSVGNKIAIIQTKYVTKPDNFRNCVKIL